jgi:sugar/nucleoside kinase (ribokinase family)
VTGSLNGAHLRDSALARLAPDYVLIGHVARDVAPGGYRPGGTVTYAGLAALALGRRVGAVTSVGPDFPIQNLFPEIQFVVRPAEVTTTFENVYTAGHRQQWVRGVAAPLDGNLVPPPWRSAPIVHLAPLAEEYGTEIVESFPQARLLGLTPQGWLRTWGPDGFVRRSAWSEPEIALDRCDAIVLSEEDVEGDWDLCARWAERARLLVVTQGARGCTVFDRGARWQLPAYPANEVEATGAGDVFAAAFFVHLLDHGNPLDAARYANCVASFAVEVEGPRGVPSAEVVAERYRSHLITPVRG